ncbi:MAG: DUF805 domain-containing protein [Chloroflexi bacterium]|nr:DUF805 domain-containing protein [Chloroflexota bacterium]
MTFTQAIASGFHRYFDFRTRSSRSEYWFWTLFLICVSVVATILDELLFDGTSVLDPISSVALFIPGLAVTVRRLHDVDRSGWWVLIAFTIVGIIFPLLYWHIKPGSPGPNRFGPNPLGVSAGGGGTNVESGVCIVCGSGLESGANFCRACGSKTVPPEDAGKFCSQCGLSLDPDARFCFSCGTGV